MTKTLYNATTFSRTWEFEYLHYLSAIDNKGCQKVINCGKEFSNIAPKCSELYMPSSHNYCD